MEINRPAYSKTKRFRRHLLKTFGHWPRQNYDVRLIHADGKPTYKQVIFKTAKQARTVSEALQRFGGTPHLPGWHGVRDNMVWVDFIEGTTCHAIDESMLAQLAECFVQFAGRESYLERLEHTPYWLRHQDNLDYLKQYRIIDLDLQRALYAHSRSCAPERVRLGFDYIDPIGANLVRRARCGRICAIDIKNLKADTLVGQGLAKASRRWLSPARRIPIFAHLEAQGLGDIPRAFAFLRLYEAVYRIRRKTRDELIMSGRAHGARVKKAQLAALLRL